MRLERVPKRKPVGITSLIDVIFLLLLFFMLASSFSRYQAFPVSSGVAGASEGDRPMLLRVHDDARWDLNGTPVAPEQLSELLRQQQEAGRKQVTIWTGTAASSQHLVDAMAAIRGTGLDAVVVTGR